MSDFETMIPGWCRKEVNAVQVHVSLDDIEPMIWRRVVMPMHVTLIDLHAIVQAAMGWSANHDYHFDIGGLRFSDLGKVDQPSQEKRSRLFDAGEVRIRDFHFIKGELPSLIYTYDTGDDWRHTIKFEQVLDVQPAPDSASCIGGAAAVRRKMLAVLKAISSFFAYCFVQIQTSLQGTAS